MLQSMHASAQRLTSPKPGATFSSAVQQFKWQDQNSHGIIDWRLLVGERPGERQFFNSGNLGTATSATVSGLPQDGSTVYVRLLYRLPRTTWQSINYTYTATTGVFPAITSPFASAPLAGETHVFRWTDSGDWGVKQWWLLAGSSVGKAQYFNSRNLGRRRSVTVTGLPVDGSDVYVRLIYRVGKTRWKHIDKVYTAIDNPLAKPTGRLNDTGTRVGGSFPAANSEDCSAGAVLAGQDCSNGRDDDNTRGSLSKTGTGSHGFDFTKISFSGTALSASATSWDCVLDNRTGYMWEVKTAAGDLHDGSDTFTWYDSNPATNGGAINNGADGANNMSCFGYVSGSPSTYCNIQAFAARVNAAGLCGYNNWRVPSYMEMLSIIDHSRVLPAIDTDFFPHTPATTSSYHWTATPIAADNLKSWNIRTLNGYGSNRLNTAKNAVRLIRTE